MKYYNHMPVETVVGFSRRLDQILREQYTNVDVHFEDALDQEGRWYRAKHIAVGAGQVSLHGLDWGVYSEGRLSDAIWLGVSKEIRDDPLSVARLARLFYGDILYSASIQALGDPVDVIDSAISRLEELPKVGDAYPSLRGVSNTSLWSTLPEGYFTIEKVAEHFTERQKA